MTLGWPLVREPTKPPRSVLHWLDSAMVDGKQVIDFGCGSGILGIAALKLGAAKVTGVDIDTQALEASRANAEYQRNQRRRI